AHECADARAGRHACGALRLRGTGGRRVGKERGTDQYQVRTERSKLDPRQRRKVVDQLTAMQTEVAATASRHEPPVQAKIVPDKLLRAIELGPEVGRQAHPAGRRRLLVEQILEETKIAAQSPAMVHHVLTQERHVAVAQTEKIDGLEQLA